jgi:hypothetical protein
MTPRLYPTEADLKPLLDMDEAIACPEKGFERRGCPSPGVSRARGCRVRGLHASRPFRWIDPLRAPCMQQTSTAPTAAEPWRKEFSSLDLLGTTKGVARVEARGKPVFGFSKAGGRRSVPSTAPAASTRRNRRLERRRSCFADPMIQVGHRTPAPPRSLQRSRGMTHCYSPAWATCTVGWPGLPVKTSCASRKEPGWPPAVRQIW